MQHGERQPLNWETKWYCLCGEEFVTKMERREHIELETLDSVSTLQPCNARDGEPKQSAKKSPVEATMGSIQHVHYQPLVDLWHRAVHGGLGE